MARLVTCAAGAAMLALAVAGCASQSQPTASNYRFEVVDAQVHPSRDAQVRVRLVHLPDNRPVSGAVIYDHRFEMWMTGYKVVTSRMIEGTNPPPILALDEGNGIYRVHAELPMAGEWRATLTARVPGEALPVRSTVAVRAGHG